MQVLERNIVYYLIIRTLKESRIDCYNRFDARFRKPRCTVAAVDRQVGPDAQRVPAAGRILDFYGEALRLCKRLENAVIGRKVHHLLPKTGKALAEIEKNRRLDVALQDEIAQCGSLRL